MSRVHNFSAGPAMLPEAVLQRAQAEIDGLARGRGLHYGDEPPWERVCLGPCRG